MKKVIKILVIVAVCYLAYANIIRGTKAEHIAVQAVGVGKQTVILGQDGLDKVNEKVHQVVK